MSALGVVIPAHNAAATIERTLTCLVAQRSPPPFEVIVVDDGSDDATPVLVEAFSDRLEVRLFTQSRQGPGAARNLGVGATDAPLIAFLDADTFPAEGWAAAIVAALAGADLVQGAVVADRAARPGPFDRTLRVDHPTALYQTANLAVRREAFEAVGGFSAWIDPGGGGRGHFGEDVDFAWRAIRAGARAEFAAAAAVEHAVFARGAIAMIAERRRCAHFPELIARVPELRARWLVGRFFLTARSRAFDAALFGVVAAISRRRVGPLLLTIPYLRISAGEARRWGPRRGPRVAVAGLFADSVALGSLLRGSIAARRAVL